MKKFLAFTYFLLLPLTAFSSVKEVSVVGLKRLHPDMVKNVISTKEDENLTDKKLNEITRKLYNTGYFNDIKITEDNGKLTVYVSENPIVSAVSFEGNSDLKLEDIKEGLE